MDSWALKAIESEAERRAARQLLELGAFNTMLGMTAKDVLLLKMFYESKTGRRAEDIQRESEFVKG